ncbi:MAG: AI-2E family transporter [Erysipelotrichia bacterium]|nr:AI-2E family transporter [Erysipelotrichia bacterium]NCC54698.1 AI-2E family transporter [Erysipelotrichia bacterium]
MFKDKQLNQLTYRNVLWIITYTFLLILCIVKWDIVVGMIGNLFSLLVPFIMAFVFAFIFNIPMRFFLRKLPDTIKKGRKAIAAALSLTCIITLFVFVIGTVVPQLADSVKLFVAEFPNYVSSTEKLVNDLIEQWGLDASFLDFFNKYSAGIEKTIISFASSLAPEILTFTKSIVSVVTNVVMAIVIAVYFTLSKDTLIRQCKRALYAFLPKQKYEYFVHVVKLSNKTFTGFVSGQLVEAIIIGVLCYIGASLLQIEFAPILAVVIGCTNVIPIFGPIIGTGLCALLLLFVNPIHAIIFTIFGIVLQQFESNLIYPRVVGTSVGLSGLWVLLAVSIGGGLFGVLGMIFGLPVFAIIYRLFAQEVNKRIKMKKTVKKDRRCAID